VKEDVLNEQDLHECEKIQDRIARLASGIAIIKVGGMTEVEMTERKHRVEDALEAVKAAQMEGIIPGGGSALLRAVSGLNVDVDSNEQEIGVKILFSSVEAPLRQMALNAGQSPDVICAQVQEAITSGDYGYNFVTGEIVDMFEAGIIDPVKVTKAALQNAASVAGTLITTNFAVIQK